MTQPSSHTALVMNRAEARRRLRERVDQVTIIFPSRVESQEDLSKAQEQEKRWRAYNRELLCRMFTTEEYAREYDLSSVPVHQVGDRYFDVDLRTLASRLQESVKRQAARIESIIDRLELIAEVSVAQAASKPKHRSKVFVVHGHDEGALQAMARFLEKIGLDAIVLRERPDRGLTVIEKFEASANEVGFAVVLLTPDDVGGLASVTEQATRARQNVIFELGYFVGKLGRGGACLLRKGDVQIPSDLAGVIYIPTWIIPRRVGRSSLPESCGPPGLNSIPTRYWDEPRLVPFPSGCRCRRRRACLLGRISRSMSRTHPRGGPHAW
jgi:predicted nucleotide-binding protein